MQRRHQVLQERGSRLGVRHDVAAYGSAADQEGADPSAAEEGDDPHAAVFSAALCGSGDFFVRAICAGC